MSDTPRTDAAVFDVDEAFVSFEGLASAPRNVVYPDFARTLERELATNRAKVRALREACEFIEEQWGKNHDANPFAAGNAMMTRASAALAATEDAT